MKILHENIQDNRLYLIKIYRDLRIFYINIIQLQIKHSLNIVIY